MVCCNMNELVLVYEDRSIASDNRCCVEGTGAIWSSPCYCYLVNVSPVYVPFLFYFIFLFSMFSRFRVL